MLDEPEFCARCGAEVDGLSAFCPECTGVLDDAIRAMGVR